MPLRVFAAYWGRRGGGARYALGMSSALAQRPGLSVCTSFSVHADDVAEFQALRGPLLPVATYPSLRAAPLASLRLPGLYAGLVRVLRTSGSDVVLTCMFHPWNGVLRAAARRVGVPVVATVHDAELHDGDGPRLLDVLVRRDADRSDGVLALSAAVANELVNAGRQPPERVLVLPLGPHVAVPADRQPRALVPGRPVRLLFCGRIRAYKGLPLLRAAYAELRASGHDVKLTVAGSGEGMPDFAGLPDVVARSGWLTPAEIDELFENADVLVLPYSAASQSGVVTIAQAHGVPIVVTPVGGLPEQVQGGAHGAVAHAVDSSAVAEAVAGLLGAPERYAAASRSALEHARGAGSWAVAARLAEAHLREIAALRQV